MNYYDFLDIAATMRSAAERKKARMDYEGGWDNIHDSRLEEIKIRTLQQVIDAANVLEQAEVFDIDAVGAWVSKQNYRGVARKTVIRLRDELAGPYSEEFIQTSLELDNE